MTAPWMETLDLQVDMIKFWRSPIGIKYGGSFLQSVRDLNPGVKPVPDDWDGPQVADNEAHILDKAQTFWVSRDMVEITDAAARSLPSCVIHEDELPHHTGFVWMDASLPVQDRHGKTHRMRGFSWTTITLRPDQQKATGTWDEMMPMPRALWMTWYSWRDDPTDTDLAGLRAEFGDRVRKLPKAVLYHFGVVPMEQDLSEEGLLPDEVAMSGFDQLPKIAKSFWRLSQQEISWHDRMKPDRHTRKRIQRAGFVPREIVVIRLRKVKGRPDRPEGEAEQVLWSHRWLVSGHWRNQWVPSLNAHRLTWISPYVKGPEDRPLITKDKVYRWDR